MWKNSFLTSLICLLFFSANFGQKDINLFAFGHSLIDHRPPAIPTPSDETTVFHWMYLLAEASGHDFRGGGKYGFLPQHRMLPPFSQWGYDLVPGVWESDDETFQESIINTVMITPGNFIQWQPPTEPYPNEGGVTPLSATDEVLDWVQEQKPNSRFYIYENWPDMAGYLSNGFPPNGTEYDNYVNYLLADFHEWNLDYHDGVVEMNPDAEVKMIPVGPTIARLLEQFPFSDIAIDELYEDDAPHGRPNIYFLAAVVTYMAIFEEKPNAEIVLPTILAAEVRDNFEEVVEFCWEQLRTFDFEDGSSRVFFGTVNTTDLATETIGISPNPTMDRVEVTHLEIEQGTIEIISKEGRILAVQEIKGSKTSIIDLSKLPAGVYFLRVMNQYSTKFAVRKVIKYN